MEVLRTIPTSELLRGVGIVFLLLYVILCIAEVVKKKRHAKTYIHP